MRRASPSAPPHFSVGLARPARLHVGHRDVFLDAPEVAGVPALHLHLDRLREHLVERAWRRSVDQDAAVAAGAGKAVLGDQAIVAVRLLRDEVPLGLAEAHQHAAAHHEARRAATDRRRAWARPRPSSTGPCRSTARWCDRVSPTESAVWATAVATRARLPSRNERDDGVLRHGDLSVSRPGRRHGRFPRLSPRAPGRCAAHRTRSGRRRSTAATARSRRFGVATPATPGRDGIVRPQPEGRAGGEHSVLRQGSKLLTQFRDSVLAAHESLPCRANVSETVTMPTSPRKPTCTLTLGNSRNTAGNASLAAFRKSRT